MKSLTPVRHKTNKSVGKVIEDFSWQNKEPDLAFSKVKWSRGALGGAVTAVFDSQLEVVR